MNKNGKTYTNKVAILLLSLGVIALTAMTVAAEPPMPHAFYGTVHINGVPAEDGALVTANIDGVQYASTTTSGGKYDLNVPADDPYTTPEKEGGVEEDTVVFFVSGIEADTYTPFEKGGITELDLTVTITTLPPAITDWSNDKTNSNATSITVNESESVWFNATADQTIATWNWTKDGADPSNNFDNYTTSWSVNGTYSVSVNATNANGTSNTVEWTIAVNDITAPASITVLQNTTYQETYINWTWTDPADDDFSKVMVYLDGIYKEDVLKGVQCYNATGLAPDTEHEIATRTVDSVGNVNATWVNHTARTKPLNMTVAATPSSVPVNTSTSVVFNVTSDGTPVDGANVTLSGAFSNVSTTGADGTVTIVVNATSTGTINVAATKDGYATAETTVTVEAPVLTTITVSPTTASLTVGDTQTFTATAYDQFGNVMPDVIFTWNSSNITVGTVDPASATTGADGNATTDFRAAADGTTEVTAANGTVNDTAAVTVLTPPDTTAPVVNTVTLNTTAPNTGDAILVTVDATDNVAVTSATAEGVELTSQGGNIWNGTIIAIEGTHSVNVSAVDAAGNTGWNNSTSYTATTPNMTVTATPGIIHKLKANITINVTDATTGAPIDGANVTLEFNGSVIASGTTVGGEYTAENVTETETGTINVTVTASGYNAGSATVGVLIGDINIDGVVNYIDLGMLGASYGLSLGDAGYNAAADINSDDTVNYIDLGMLGAHYGESV